jgi:hypothetical protein
MAWVLSKRRKADQLGKTLDISLNTYVLNDSATELSEKQR